MHTNSDVYYSHVSFKNARRSLPAGIPMNAEWLWNDSDQIVAACRFILLLEICRLKTPRQPLPVHPNRYTTRSSSAGMKVNIVQHTEAGIVHRFISDIAFCRITCKASSVRIAKWRCVLIWMTAHNTTLRDLYGQWHSGCFMVVNDSRDITLAMGSNNMSW